MELQLDEGKINKIENLIADEMRKMKIGGLTFAIVNDGKIIHSQGFGARDLNKNLPADLNSIFNIASLSKSFVCTAILILVDRGIIQLQDPVDKFLPIKIDTGKPITIKHLMNHTSGIPDLAADTFTYFLNKNNLKTRTTSKMVPMTTKSDFYRIINNGQEYSHEIDEYFHYNNYAYALLGLIIEEATAKKFTEFIKEEIFTPCEMNSTSFNPENFKDNDNLSIGYHNVPNGPEKGTSTKVIQYASEKWEFHAAGGIFSSVNDLSNYMIMHMDGGKFKDKTILSTEKIREMRTDSLIQGSQAKKVLSNYAPTGTYGYGYGFFTNSDFYGYQFAGHGGNMIGGTADFSFIPQKKIGVISLANNFMGPRPIISSILALLIGTDEEKIHFLAERKHYKKLNGIYEGYNESERVKITGEVGNITISNIEPEEWSGPPITFQPFDNGELTPLEFSTRLPGGAKFIIFFEEKNEELWLNFERTRYKRISPL